MNCMNTTKCSCGCSGCKCCDFNPCAVTCSGCVQSFGDYAYIYNTTAQTVAADGSVTFSANGNLSGSITHTAGTAEAVIGRSGVYLVSFYAEGGAEETPQLTLYQNSQPVIGATYSGTETVNGQLIVAAQTGDILTLVNTGADPITLTEAGTTPEAVVNASMTIVRLF